jgi:hypothetical protein
MKLWRRSGVFLAIMVGVVAVELHISVETTESLT